MLTVVKMIFSSVEGKKTRTGRSLKEFFFPDCEQRAKDYGVFSPENSGIVFDSV